MYTITGKKCRNCTVAYRSATSSIMHELRGVPFLAKKYHETSRPVVLVFSSAPH